MRARHTLGSTERTCRSRQAELLERHIALPRRVAVLRHAVGTPATHAGATDHQRHDIASAVPDERCHTRLPRRAAPARLPCQVTLRHNVLEVVIADDGIGMPAPHTHPHAGRGPAIIAGTVQHLEISDAAPGTLVRLTFAIG